MGSALRWPLPSWEGARLPGDDGRRDPDRSFRKVRHGPWLRVAPSRAAANAAVQSPVLPSCRGFQAVQRQTLRQETVSLSQCIPKKHSQHLIDHSSALAPANPCTHAHTRRRNRPSPKRASCPNRARCRGPGPRASCDRSGQWRGFWDG